MLLKKGGEIPSSEITPKDVYLNRREFMKAGAVGLGALALGAYGLDKFADPETVAHAASKLPGVVKGSLSTTGEKLTSLDDITHYNNFYEYGTDKDVFAAAQQLQIRPWTIKIDGMVEKPIEIGIDDLMKKMTLEERTYRHRCVEAWSMAIAWSGFPFKKLVEFAKPLGSAKYIEMQTFMDPKVAPGQRARWYPWPYIEGVTMAEAANDLAFLATGAYGHPLGKVQGAPLRLALPWKYGFKSIKSVVRFSFVEKRPIGMWEKLQAAEYGFWANVNPEVPHPRWSQATEEVIGTGERRPTLIYNGYGEFVADLYKGLEKERLWA